MPPLFFAVAFMLAMGLPLFTAQSPIPVFGDAITIMYSLALARFFFALCGVDSSNAYAGIGGVRELLMSVLIEPSMLLALFAAALVCGSTDIATMGQHIMTGTIDAPVAVILAGIAFAIACYMELGKLPFDQAEAEQELQEGPLAELSGPSLALAKLAMSMKQVLVVAWFCAIFVPWGEPATVGAAAVLGAVIFLVKCLIDFVVCGVIENSRSRSRFKVLKQSDLGRRGHRRSGVCLRGRRRVGEGRNNVICSQSVPSRLGRYRGPDGGLGARRPVPVRTPSGSAFGCRRLDGLHHRPRREFRWRRHARHAGPPDLVWADLVMGFTFDRMSTLLAPAFVGIGLLVVIYSIPYMSENNREHPDAPRRRFYAYLATFIGAMAGLVYSSTLLGQLVFFEITGACSWGLISYYLTPTAKKAGMKALIITHIGALGLYLGAAIVFAHTGTFAITAIAGLDAKLKAIVLLLVLFAAWAKSAQVPMYMWLPSAMEAPTPVSAYLHGASMVKVGVCVFARALVSAGEIPEIVGWVAIIDAMVTMLFGFLMYLPQKDMKRLLAFSTIAQLSYVFFGLGLSVFGSQLAFDGAVCHIFNHAFAKTLFFLIAGSFSFTLGTRMLPKLRGIVKKYPISGVGFGVAALAIAGVPPMNTFFSKFQIIAGGFSVGAGNVAILVLVCIMVAETVATFAWFL
ncbi:MAG: hydrogenase 4 subunit D, partial [Collinsella sp.]